MHHIWATNMLGRDRHLLLFMCYPNYTHYFIFHFITTPSNIIPDTHTYACMHTHWQTQKHNFTHFIKQCYFVWQYEYMSTELGPLWSLCRNFTKAFCSNNKLYIIIQNSRLKNHYWINMSKSKSLLNEFHVILGKTRFCTCIPWTTLVHL